VRARGVSDKTDPRMLLRAPKVPAFLGFQFSITIIPRRATLLHRYPLVRSLEHLTRGTIYVNSVNAFLVVVVLQAS